MSPESNTFIDLEQQQSSIEGAWSSLKSQPSNCTKDAKYYREAFCDYFNNHGAVSWQDDYI